MAVLFAGFLASATADDGESLTYNSNTGVYTIEYYNTYDGPTPVLKHAQFELPTRIDPTVKFTLKESAKGLVVYQYRVRSGKESKQDLNFVQLRASEATAATQNTPAGWEGEVNPQPDAPGSLVNWFQTFRGLKPGQSQGGFSIQSQDLPGVGFVQTWGRLRRDLQGFSDLGPTSATSIGKQYVDLVNNNDSVRRTAAVPRIPVPNPFDATVVLTNLQRYLDQDLVSMKLIDSVLVTQLDRLFIAAIDAAKRNNITGLRNNLKDIRQALKKEHEDVDKDENEDKDDNQKAKSGAIDKLAARVLDFDVKVILKRIDDGESENRNPPPPASGPPR
ncbi:MAG TPA: hypothetical protein VK138_04360 [Acidiferrobacterales bacterium]|nr:hypothetical protein [Acidiferrobacterales bacterium]